MGGGGAAGESGEGVPWQAQPAQRTVRPFSGTVRYTGNRKKAEPALARRPLGKRLLNPHVLYQLSMLTLVKLLEAVGLFGPRGCCSNCGASPGDEQFREQQRVRTFRGPGGLDLQVNHPYLSWRCSGGCSTEAPVLRSCEVANVGWSLQQNAMLLWGWCKQQEPSGDDLALAGFVDAVTVPTKWQAPLRSLVAEEQLAAEGQLQLGGVGVDVEIDEVCFRWRKILRDGKHLSLVDRYLCLAERDSRKMLLVPLPQKVVAVGGRTGAIGNEELYAALFPKGRPPLLLPGTVVHTDSAKAYRNLGWTGSAADAEMPADLAGELTGERPAPWRWETQEEADERREAEAAAELGTLAGRTEEWASRYRHLRLVHTAVVHKKRPGRKRQFVVMRRCRFMPEDAAALRTAGTEPFLLGDTTWRKGGTQKVDGYWRLLRQRVSNRGANSGTVRDETRKRVLVHQWAHAAGPAVDLFEHLGATLKARRTRAVVDLEVAQRAWEEACQEEEAVAEPVHVHAGRRVWVEQVWRRQAVVARGTKRACEAQGQEQQAARRKARTVLARSAFSANAAARQLLRTRERAAAQVAAAAQAAQEQLERARDRENESRRRAEAAEAGLDVAFAEAAGAVAYAAAPVAPIPSAPGTPPAEPPPAEPVRRRLVSLRMRAQRHFELQRDEYNRQAAQRLEHLQLYHPGSTEHTRLGMRLGSGIGLGPRVHANVYLAARSSCNWCPDLGSRRQLHARCCPDAFLHALVRGRMPCQAHAHEASGHPRSTPCDSGRAPHPAGC